MGLREEKKEQQRQAILETAVGLFRERGFEQTRVQDVTDRLRISEATFFNYFPTKQSVLEAAAVDLLDRTTASSTATPRTRAARCWSGWRSWCGRSPRTSPGIVSSPACWR